MLLNSGGSSTETLLSSDCITGRAGIRTELKYSSHRASVGTGAGAGTVWENTEE